LDFIGGRTHKLKLKAELAMAAGGVVSVKNR
jgi:hypothetical protein